MVLIEFGYIVDVLWAYTRYLSFVFSVVGEHFISRVEFSDSSVADEGVHTADENATNRTLQMFGKKFAKHNMSVPTITVDGQASRATLRILASLPRTFGIVIHGLRELVKKAEGIVLHPEAASDADFYLHSLMGLSKDHCVFLSIRVMLQSLVVSRNQRCRDSKDTAMRNYQRWIWMAIAKNETDMGKKLSTFATFCSADTKVATSLSVRLRVGACSLAVLTGQTEKEFADDAAYGMEYQRNAAASLEQTIRSDSDESAQEEPIYMNIVTDGMRGIERLDMTERR